MSKKSNLLTSSCSNITTMHKCYNRDKCNPLDGNYTFTDEYISGLISRLPYNETDQSKIKTTLLGLTMSYTIIPTKKEIMLFDKLGERVGKFNINGRFDTGETVDMGISLEDDFQNKKLSKLMVAALCEMIVLDYPNIRKDQLFFIDADASGGFWDAMGMKVGRYSSVEKRAIHGNTRKSEGEGYAKEIKFSDMSKWALGVGMTVNRINKKR